MKTGFEALSVAPELVGKLRDREIVEPTPIQAEAIPPILEGKDVIGRSQTGTGKTLAYLLPLLQRIDASARRTQALVLVPTRELGMQIVQEAERLAEHGGIRVLALIGGAALSRQADKLREHPQLTVGTPGRVLELIKLRKLSMHHVRTIVIDEVDQVLDLGSASEVETILKSALRDRQLLFFSATMSAESEAIASRWMRNPVRVAVNPSQRAAENLEHLYFICDRRDKIDTVRRLVRNYEPKSAIVFINETDPIAEAVAKLRYVGLSVEALYGDAAKQERAKVMKGFRDGKFQLLLATDIAARGLDIPDVSHIINLDLPPDADHYVHRAGRTGRMGRAGTVLSIATVQEQPAVEKLARALNVPIVRKVMYAGRVVDFVPGAKAETTRKEEPQPRSVKTPANAPQESGRAKTAAVPSPSAAALPKRPLTPKAKPASPKDRSKSERERDRKNKGAPKWLKEKKAKDR